MKSFTALMLILFLGLSLSLTSMPYISHAQSTFGTLLWAQQIPTYGDQAVGNTPLSYGATSGNVFNFTLPTAETVSVGQFVVMYFVSNTSIPSIVSAVDNLGNTWKVAIAPTPYFSSAVNSPTTELGDFFVVYTNIQNAGTNGAKLQYLTITFSSTFTIPPDTYVNPDYYIYNLYSFPTMGEFISYASTETLAPAYFEPIAGSVTGVMLYNVNGGSYYLANYANSSNSLPANSLQILFMNVWQNREVSYPSNSIITTISPMMGIFNMEIPQSGFDGYPNYFLYNMFFFAYSVNSLPQASNTYYTIDFSSPANSPANNLPISLDILSFILTFIPTVPFTLSSASATFIIGDSVAQSGLSSEMVPYSYYIYEGTSSPYGSAINSLTFDVAKIAIPKGGPSGVYFQLAVFNETSSNIYSLIYSKTFGPYGNSSNIQMSVNGLSVNIGKSENYLIAVALLTNTTGIYYQAGAPTSWYYDSASPAPSSALVSADFQSGYGADYPPMLYADGVNTAVIIQIGGSTSTTTTNSTQIVYKTVYVNEPEYALPMTNVQYWIMPLFFLIVFAVIGAVITRYAGVSNYSVPIITLFIFIGSLLASFAQIMPIGITIFLGILTAIVFWRASGG